MVVQKFLEYDIRYLFNFNKHFYYENKFNIFKCAKPEARASCAPLLRQP